MIAWSAPGLAAITVAFLGLRNGGYFPVSWGGPALGLWLLCFFVLLSRSGLPTVASATFIAALGAFCVWTGLSAVWSRSVPLTFNEIERDSVVLATITSVVLLSRRRSGHRLATSVFVSLASLSALSLAGYLFTASGRAGGLGENRLTGPLGYWNALSLVAAMALLLAVGMALVRPARRLGVAAASLVPLLAATLYLTFGRGGWLALAAGTAVLIAVAAPRRRTLLTLVLLGACGACGVLAIAVSDHPGSPRSKVAVVAALVGAGAVSARVPRAVDWLARRMAFRRVGARVWIVLAIGLACLAALALTRVPEAVTTAHDAFDRPISAADTSLSRRLVSLSGNGRSDYWHVAWRNVARHPWLGSGAGTFEVAWNAQRPDGLGARDAHNLYLETLSELGPVGLALLIVALAVPLVAAVRLRGDPLIGGAAAAYAAFGVHAAFDWDWEMPAVTIAALLCGAAVVLQGGTRPRIRRHASKYHVLACATAAVLVAASVVVHFGNGALASSTRSLGARHYAAAAAEARSAIRWAPWSSEAWRLLAAAQVGEGRVRDARRSLVTATKRDPSNWQAWADLLTITRGSVRVQAVERLAVLNPYAIGTTRSP